MARPPAGPADAHAADLIDMRPFAPIGLEEIAVDAALQTRVDRKYVLSTADAAAVVATLARQAEGTRVLEIDGDRVFRYLSTYFDTPELDSYRLTAHRRRRRFKVRTRSYVDTGSCYLEVKTRGPRGTTVKHRLAYAPDAADQLTDDGRSFVDAVLAAVEVPAFGPALSPVLVTGYRRSTLHLAGGAGGAGGLVGGGGDRSAARLTIDQGLTWQVGDDRAVGLPGVTVLETKTSSTPSAADRVLWSLGHRPIGISKFGTGMAALHPELPATRWHRLLTRLIDRDDPTAFALATRPPASPTPSTSVPTNDIPWSTS